MSAFGIEIIEHKFPHTTTHVRQSETVSSFFSVVIHGRQEGKAVTPRSVRQRPDSVASWKKVDG